MIAHIVYHWVKPDQMKRAEELFEANGRAVRTKPGLVGRYILRSKSDPLKVAAINVWESRDAWQNWMKASDHIFDGYGRPLTGPPDSEYIKKYANAGHFDDRPPVAEEFEVIPG